MNIKFLLTKPVYPTTPGFLEWFSITEKKRLDLKYFFMNANKILIGAVIVVIICFLIYISFALISIPFVLLLSLF